MDPASAPDPVPRPADLGFGLLFDRVSDAVVVGDVATGRVVAWNPAAEALYGYPAAQAVGMPLDAFLPPGPAADCAGQVAAVPEIPEPIELQIQRPDGTRRWIALTVGPLRPGDPACTRFVSIARDVSARRAAEEALATSEARFQAFMANMPAVAFIKDAERRYVFVNHRAERVLRMAAEDVLGHRDVDLFPEAFVAELEAHDTRVLEHGETVQGIERTSVDGVERTWLSFKFPLTNAAGERLLGGVTIDLSEREHLERLRQSFVATVSHEMRTPLTAIHAALRILADGLLGPLPPAMAGPVATAAQVCVRLTRLVDDVLDMERMRVGQILIEPAPCRADDLAREAADGVAPLAAAAGVTIAVDAPPASLDADADRVVQVLTNLLGNALKHAPGGSVIDLAVQARPGAVAFQVRDRGPGVADGHLERIFERFYRAEPGGVTAPNGLGLGLAIARSLVEQHGGRIWAERPADGGLAVWFTLPAAEPPAAPPPPPPPPGG